MDHAPRNHKSLARLEVDRSALEIDDEVSVEHKKELIVLVVLVPVILALHDAETDHGVVDLAERLVVPAIGARADQSGHIDDSELRKFCVEKGSVRVVFRVGHVTILAVVCSLLTPSAVSKVRSPSHAFYWGWPQISLGDVRDC